MTLPDPRADPGSFRDPGGRVYHWQDRVFRTLSAPAVAEFEFVRSTGLLDRLAADGLILPVEAAGSEAQGAMGAGGEQVLEQIGRAHAELQSLLRTSYAVFCLKKK